jgi:hypothetical protein
MGMTMIKRILCLGLALILSLGLAACGAEQEEPSKVLLDYGTGFDEKGNYNNVLYGMNTVQDLNMADPGCFFVSEEEDPQWGGYYYMYPTSFATNDGYTFQDVTYEGEKVTNYNAMCYRSKDLYQWEVCGVLPGGYCMVVDAEDWCQDYYWAPEVIRNPADGKYYMYYNAVTPKNYGVAGLSNSDLNYDRFYIGVAVSDTPAGPFDVLYDMDMATGKRIPTINFQMGCNTQYPWAVIDISPFFDDDGQLYLYFNKHPDDHYTHLRGVWGMRMKSMTIPDYSTVSCLTIGGRTTASNTPGQIEEVTEGPAYVFNETLCNEGPFMLKHNGKYYLTYSANGYDNPDYSVYQAISDDPLTGFRKLELAEGNPVLQGGSFVEYMNGTAHHSFVKHGDELWIVYHRHNSIYGYDIGGGRSISVDRASFVPNGDGLDVLQVNGPSRILQWLPECVSGYRNLAQDADISISSGTGIQYLVDGLLPYYSLTADRILQTQEELEITLTWDKPVKVSSVMLYNARKQEAAFSKISRIEFTFAEKPQWASRDYTHGVIQDVMLPEYGYDAIADEYQPFAPVVAEFNEISVTEMKITIKAEDRLMKMNQMGEVNTALELSELVVLGGETENAQE